MEQLPKVVAVDFNACRLKLGTGFLPLSQFHLWQFAKAAAEELLGELRELRAFRLGLALARRLC